MLRGRAANAREQDQPGQGSGGRAEISLAWEAPRPLLPGKLSLLAIGVTATVAAIWALGISNSASALTEAWSTFQPRWHLVRPETTSPVVSETMRVAEPDAPAAITIAPVGGNSSVRPLATTRTDGPAAAQAEMRDAGSAMTILTSTALEQASENVGSEGQPAAGPDAEHSRIAGGTTAKPSGSAARARRDTSWTGSFFER